LLGKGRPRAGLFIAVPAKLLPAAAIAQQTVDGCYAALEIRPRSSYVPSAPIGVRCPGYPAMRALNTGDSQRPE
jgi:hypothetical protein